jgi:hypothetical protein
VPSPASISLGECAPLTVRTGFGRRIFYGFAALALLSLAISLAGRWAGQTIVTGGHSADATLREIVIGNDVLAVPANMIRFENARRDGAAGRLDLYVRWPQMDGYNVAARDAFNHVDGDRTILFVSLEPRLMSRDMSSRFEPIYRRLFEDEARAGPGGLAIHRFAPDIHVGDDLSLTYRMPAQLAAEWPAVEAAIRALAASLIQGQAGG